MTLRRVLAAGVALTLATSASADVFPARAGELGILDVPDAETSGVGGGKIAVEMGFDKSAGSPSEFGPLPIYAVGGVSESLDLGFTLRSGREPGDEQPSRTLLGAAAKLQLWAPNGALPGAALSLAVDGMNARTTTGLRLALSTPRGRVRFAAFGGAESVGVSAVDPGWTAGLAARFPFTRGGELVLEGLTGPRGKNYGFAVRRMLRPSMAVSLGANYFPAEEGFRISLGIAFAPTRATRIAPEAPKVDVPVTPAPTTVGPRFTEARPRFRLRMPLSAQRLGEPGRQHGPWTPTVAAAVTERRAAPTAMPTLDDLADAQLRDQEALADGRERRVRATADQLDEREKAALAEVARLQQREIELLAREQELDARDRRIAVRGTPTQQQRDLQSLEAQLASQERNLLAQDRSFAPALDAARGRERDAAAREEVERQEANRLASSAAGVSSRSLQLDLRKQALAARNRRLAAFEARLVAKGERIDAIARQGRLKRDRLDAIQRRLDARTERLDLIERRPTEPRPAPAGPAAPARPAEGGAMIPKDRAVFVMVVKTPSAIVKGQPAAPAAPAPSAASPGVSVEKVVAAATVVTFATPAAQLTELDRETIDRIAKLAARDRCEVLIWARAKDPALHGEAQRRAAEVRARALASGPLSESQVVTRITTRPSTQGVDVVVTAMRETTKPAEDAPAAPPPRGPALDAGETGKRQIRQAVQLAQGSIEACVAELMDQRKLARAEGVLKLTISPAGKVSRIGTEGELASPGIAECLTGVSASWTFPHADAEYLVDVPITVMRGEAGR